MNDPEPVERASLEAQVDLEEVQRKLRAQANEMAPLVAMSTSNRQREQRWSPTDWAQRKRKRRRANASRRRNR